MFIAAAILLILSIAGLIGALAIGSPTPGYPRDGTFGVNGLESSVIAWTCVGLCAVGLILLFLDARREKSAAAQTHDSQPAPGAE
jgi:hypothetical protein